MRYNGNMTNECSTKGCDGTGRLKRGMCAACYVWSRTHDWADPANRKRRASHVKRVPGETCSVVEHGERCTEPQSRGTLCNKHRLRKARYGDPLIQRHASPGKGMAPYEYTKRRRARKASAFVEDVLTDVVVATHGRWCYLCESPIVGELQVDHVEPLSRGGEHSYDNTRPTHPHCNLSKKDRFLHELDLPFVPPHLKVVV